MFPQFISSIIRRVAIIKAKLQIRQRRYQPNLP